MKRDTEFYISRFLHSHVQPAFSLAWVWRKVSNHLSVGSGWWFQTMESHTESCHFRSKSLSKFHFLDGGIHGILEVFADKDAFVDSTSRHRHMKSELVWHQLEFGYLDLGQGEKGEKSQSPVISSDLGVKILWSFSVWCKMVQTFLNINMFSLFQYNFVDDVVQFCTSVCSVARVFIYIY